MEQRYSMYTLEDFFDATQITHTRPPKGLASPLMYGLQSHLVLNPLRNHKGVSTSRDEDVFTSHNYLFEMDNTPLNLQYRHLNTLIEHQYIATAVYSGAKSIHHIIRANQSVDKDTYRFVWHTLNELFFDGRADVMTARPANLTRTPTYKRDNGNIQNLIYAQSNILDISDIVKDYIENKQWAFRALEQKRAFDTLKTVKPSQKNKTYKGNQATFDPAKYVKDCANKKGSMYAQFVNKTLSLGDYEAKQEGIKWLYGLTNPYTQEHLFNTQDLIDFISSMPNSTQHLSDLTRYINTCFVR